MQIVDKARSDVVHSLDISHCGIEIRHGAQDVKNDPLDFILLYWVLRELSDVSARDVKSDLIIILAWMRNQFFVVI